MVAVKKKRWTWWQLEQENANSKVYFTRRKKERDGDGVRSAPCGLICYRENGHE